MSNVCINNDPQHFQIHVLCPYLTVLDILKYTKGKPKAARGGLIYSLMHSESCLCVQLFPDTVLDMLYMADMYLLPGLKRLCGSALAKTVCEDNVLEVWKTAKLFSLSRLEDQCKELMAKIIEKVNVWFRVCVCMGAMMVVYIFGGNSENILHETRAFQFQNKIHLFQYFSSFWLKMIIHLIQ